MTSGGSRSGLGFAPTAQPTVPFDQNFVIGTLQHFNFPVFGAISSVDLHVHLTAQTADGNLTFDLPFTIGVTETPNQEPCPFRAAPTDVACPDKLTLPAGGVHADQPTGAGTLHPHTYTLTVLGFTTSPTDTTPASQLITQEDQTNTGYLVASISRDDVAPIAADDPGNTTTSGGSTTIDVLGNDSDADSDALTPSIATPPGGGTAVVNADGTITYTAYDDFKGTDTFTYSDSDGFKSSPAATVTVDVADTTKPTITVPSSNPGGEATGPTTPVTYTVTGSDNVDGPLTPTCDPQSGSSFTVGTTAVTCTLTDGSGNTQTATFNVTVTDTTGPSFAGVPSVQPVEATGPGGAPVTYTPPTATDLVDGPVDVTCVPQSGSTFQLGTDTVTCTATDSQGNPNSATFTVTVQDKTAPTLHLPGDITSFSSDGGPMAVSYTATATDLVDGTADTVTCSPASGSTFDVGQTTVNCTATDHAGNTATGSFTVTVVPNRPPVCTDVRALGVANLWPVNHKLVLITLTGATDPDNDTLTYTIGNVTQDEKVTGGGSGNTAFDAQRASGASVYLRSERAGTGDGRVYTIAFTVSDGHRSCSSTIDVKVPHDASHDAVKSATSYNSFG